MSGIQPRRNASDRVVRACADPGSILRAGLLGLAISLAMAGGALAQSPGPVPAQASPPTAAMPAAAPIPTPAPTSPGSTESPEAAPLDSVAARNWAKLPPVSALGKGNDCTWARNIDDWEAVDRDHLIVKDGRKRFLVRFSGTCFANPNFEVSIGVVSTDGRLCPYGGDALLIDGERCTILRMWELPSEKRD